jgi:hypothetical protein
MAYQTNYKGANLICPKYRYVKFSLNNLSSTSVQWLATSSTNLEFKVPSCVVWNPSRSYITYQYSLPAVANNYGFVYMNNLDFRTVFFGSQSGLPIVDVQFSDCMVNVLRPISTRFSEFITMDPLGVLSPCNELATQNLLPYSRDGLATGTETNATRNFQELQHLQIGTAVNTAISVNRYVPLSALACTFLAMDKDVVFSQDMLIRLSTNYLTRMYGYTTNPQQINGNYTAPNANINVSNIFLHLASEENLTIKNSLLNALSSGSIKVHTPYTYVTRFSEAGGSSSFNQSLTITKAYGRYLKRFITIPYNAQEFTNHAYNHANLNGSKVTQIQTLINGRPNTDQLVNCYNPNSSLLTWWVNAPSDIAMDYRENSQFLQDTAIGSYAEYQTNWHHQDCFGVKLGVQKYQSPENDLILDGYSLDQQGEAVFQISCQTPAVANNSSDVYANGLLWYVIQVFQRSLSIVPTGFSWDY